MAGPPPGARVIDLTLLADGGIGWIDASGPASPLVLSTRIRLATMVRAGSRSKLSSTLRIQYAGAR